MAAAAEAKAEALATVETKLQRFRALSDRISSAVRKATRAVLADASGAAGVAHDISVVFGGELRVLRQKCEEVDALWGRLLQEPLSSLPLTLHDRVASTE